MSIMEDVGAAVAIFKGGGKVDEVIQHAQDAGLPLKQTVSAWLISTDAKLSKRKATQLAKDALTVFWANKGKSEFAADISKVSETHTLDRKYVSNNGDITYKLRKNPEFVVRHQGDLARVLTENRHLREVNEDFKAQLAELRAIISGGKVINIQQQEAPAATEAAPQ